MLELHHLIKAYPFGKGRAPGRRLFPCPGEIVGLWGERGGKPPSSGASWAWSGSGGGHPDGQPLTWDLVKLSFASCEHTFFPSLTPQAHRDFTPPTFPPSATTGTRP